MFNNDRSLFNFMVTPETYITDINNIHHDMSISIINKL